MLLPDSLLPNQRVLLLGIPELAVVVDLAQRLSEGLLVAIGDEERVREARRICSDLDNVMFALFDGKQIPWQNGFFDAVFDVRGESAEELRNEIERVTEASSKGAGRP